MNPLSAMYGAATAARNSLFDRKIIFRSQRLQRPVISIGNLSVGGTGKTPFVIALGELLKARNIAFDVLSRGYGRTVPGVRVVQADGDSAHFGDEPLLIRRGLDVPVVVGESRFAAGQLAEQKFQSQVHLLDDGFQHRSLARDFDIVLLAESDLSDNLLPVGRLREPLTSLVRANAIVVTVGLDQAVATRISDLITAISPRPLLCQTQRIFNVEKCSAAPIAFCGIARPQQFFANLRAANISPAAEVNFRDHHAYTKHDIDRLLAMKSKVGALGFVTTEKDAINLGSWQDHLQPLAAASLQITLERPDDLIDAIMARIAKRSPHS
jgi:tetraacyldisaccharide 4'-kinase